MPKISVVIPVYNTGHFLDRTLASITRQTLQDLDIICVNDGSTDNSLEILRKWEKNDPRVRVIAFPENRGVSSARNCGMDLAMAPYLYFMDSDDWLDDDYLESMYSKALETGHDIVINTSMVREYEDARPASTEPGNFGFSKPGYYSPAVVQSHLLSVLVMRLYKREFVVQNNIRFPNLKHGGEDNYFASLAELQQTRSYVYFGPSYHYWQREGSLAHSMGRGFSYIQSYRLLFDELVARHISLKGLKLFYCDIFTIQSREEFDYIRSYLIDASEAILGQRELYTVLDNLFFDAVTTSPDYESFLTNHNPNIALDYLRKHLKDRQVYL